MPLSEAVQVRLWGDLACFTRPELKVERVSYPVMTPSAARGALEAILWKPEFRWVIERIAVLRPVQYLGVRRNEVQTAVPTGTVERWLRSGRDAADFPPLYADSRGPGGVATQRNTLALRNVAYAVTARIRVSDAVAEAGNPPRKYQDIFTRRVEHGQCWQRPYLGCREFAAEFAPLTPGEAAILDSTDLGLMLYDVVFGERDTTPVFFPARLERGALDTRPEVALPDVETRTRLRLC